MNQSRIILVRPLVVLLAVTCCIIGQTKATSANLSNDWTLPQEGFPVFYRFFRDKISWFEADAVCQFHHGNLVTVNNGIQFDSTRAFLRELDVLDTVWIGLKSSAGSSSFNWANSEPLDNNAGYWAESFPSTENPLCAALDPTRSFRWHALNCNGPATAAFLCELPVPAWGSHCTVTAMPSVTIQYLSDVAAIRLSRDCGDEEGERHVLCRAGENRATVLSQLTCIHNASPSTEGDVYATSDESLYTTEEDASTTRSSMESAIDKIVTEIQSIATNDSLNGELEPMKPRKQVLPKKYTPLEKKSQRMQLEKELRMKKAGQKTVTSQVEFATTDRTDSTAPLPREKKMRPEDLKHSLSSSTGGYVDVVKEERVRRETLNLPLTSTTTEEAVKEEEEIVATTTTLDDEFIISGNYSGESDIVSLSNNTTTEEDNEWSLEGFKNSTEEELHNTETSSEGPVTVEITTSGQTQPTTPQPETVGQFATPHTTLPIGAITHPMHISSDMTKEFNEGRNKEKSSNNQQDHFVPPMLLVKAKFTPNKPSQQHVETTEDNINATVNAVESPQHTIERPPLLESISNDISKFYPASTEKAVMVEEEEENKVLVEIPEAVNNISVTTKAPSKEEVVTVASTTTTTPTPVSASVDQQQLDPVQDAESKKYHSEYSFSNIENYQPYRPNRRRALTKSASRSYLRKILG